MDKELIISLSSSKVEIALMEDKQLVELHSQKTNSNFSVGDIFLGRIRKLMPGLNAAFVDIGYKKDAFLHYTDLGPKLKSLNKYVDGSIKGSINTSKLDKLEFEPEIIKTGKVENVLQKKGQILVQVLKEPISTKGPRLSCEITLPGRYIVLTPLSNSVTVSKKITNVEERQRLIRLGKSICPKNFGLIIRTASEGKKVADLYEELIMLNEKWQQVHEQLHKSVAPAKMLSELDKTSSILRDILSDSFNKILVDDKELYYSIRSYLQQIAPDKVKIVSYFNDTRLLFDKVGITRQIKTSFGRVANMSSGAYLIIEHTEAMHVIDVNSGHKVTKGTQADGVLAVNVESAKEIARQLRLRDIGGIIIVDFIDMKISDHRKELLRVMIEVMRKDRAQHTILPLSKFGLMQITRQRVRPEIKIDTSEACPNCAGTGKISPAVLVTDHIERDVQFIIKSLAPSKLTLKVHPFVFSFLSKGWLNSARMKWFSKYGKWVRLKEDGNLGMLDYHFYDENSEEIRLGNKK